MRLYKKQRHCPELTTNNDCSLLSHLRDLQKEKDKLYNNGLAYIMPKNVPTFDEPNKLEYQISMIVYSSGSSIEKLEEAIKVIQNTIRYEQVHKEISELKKRLDIK